MVLQFASFLPLLLLLLLIPSCLFSNGIFALPLGQAPPTDFILVQQNPTVGKQLLAQPAMPTFSSASSFSAQQSPIFYSPAQQIPSPPPVAYNMASACCPPSASPQLTVQKRVKRGCCCCCKPCCCCCCCRPCCCGCALNICVKPSCCCKCCPTCCCCPGYGCKKRRKRAMPVSPLIESMPMPMLGQQRPFGDMKWQKRG